jgi:hypothetical protein
MFNIELPLLDHSRAVSLYNTTFLSLPSEKSLRFSVMTYKIALDEAQFYPIGREICIQRYLRFKLKGPIITKRLYICKFP